MSQEARIIGFIMMMLLLVVLNVSDLWHSMILMSDDKSDNHVCDDELMFEDSGDPFIDPDVFEE